MAAEHLDELAPEDPRARGSRRDLRRVNSLMLHPRMMASLLLSHELQTVLEIGAGDGAFMLKVARRIAAQAPHPRPHLTLLDRQPVVSDADRAAYGTLGWECDVVTSDVFDYLSRPDNGPFDAISANLFLHHFENDRLAELLRLVASKTDLFVACEPHRSPRSLAGSRMLWAVGCNDVTRHDATVSVLAGFRDREISTLWPNRADWSLHERAVPPFSHVFKAKQTR